MPLGGHSREVRGFSSQRPSSSPRSPTSYRVNPAARSDEDGRRGNKGSIPLQSTNNQLSTDYPSNPGNIPLPSLCFPKYSTNWQFRFFEV